MRFVAIILFQLALGVAFAKSQDVDYKFTPSQAGEHGKAGRTIYPNPCTDVIHLSGYNAKSIRVFDLIGNLVKTSNTGNYLDTSALPAGIYVMEITEEGKVTKERFIKRL